MVYVELLKDVYEGGRSKEEALAILKLTGHRPIPKVVRGVVYVRGATVTMHEESAKKWVKRGLAKIVKAPK